MTSYDHELNSFELINDCLENGMEENRYNMVPYRQEFAVLNSPDNTQLSNHLPDLSEDFMYTLHSSPQTKHQIEPGSCNYENYHEEDSVTLNLNNLDYLDEDVNYQTTHYDVWSYGVHSDKTIPNSSLPGFNELANSLRKNNDYRTTTYQQAMDRNLHSIEEDENVMCRKGKRGAKHVLLWKFLLERLRDSPDLVRWTDKANGIFRFVDTMEISRQWGTKKGKGDMTFEKLSRAIRHYYKSGFMSRQEGTRLVYKINWKMVPKALR